MPIFKRDDIQLYYEEHGVAFPDVKRPCWC